ncbi:MAG TPA: beta-propeller fold lactonase family protein, partial [Candidatus Binatia bacterium]|nr:beta-propeller fold lactonase family protein [Candidatus Binatia bacterium]
MRLFILLAVTASFAGCAHQPQPARTQRAEPDLPGARGTNLVQLPNMWSLRPVGRQIALGDFPVNIAVHPDGKFAAVLHSGHGQHEIVVVEIASGRTVSHASLDECFYGLAFSQDGKTLFCSGAGDETVHSFSFAKGFLSDQKTVQLRDKKLRGIPGGLAVTKDADRLFVANVWGHRVTEVNLTSQSVGNEILLGTNKLVAFEAQKASTEDEDAIKKRAEAALDTTTSADPFPYTCLIDEKRERLYVSLWAQAAVAVINLKDNEIVARWKTEEHPNEMLLSKSGKYLFVANANRNTVSILDTDSGRIKETLLAELVPNSPPGSTPNSLALSPDEKLLFVANANINAISVFDIAELGKSRSLGFIPVGWYPTSVRVTPDGKHLLVANGKGLISKANRNGPQPTREPPPSVREYIGGLLRGTLSIIDLPARDRLEEQMKRYTAQAYACLPKTNALTGVDVTSLPIKYCIYIIKENRTYDQVLGDMPKGNGDPSLCLFNERITPNHHKLA